MDKRQGQHEAGRIVECGLGEVRKFRGQLYQIPFALSPCTCHIKSPCTTCGRWWRNYQFIRLAAKALGVGPEVFVGNQQIPRRWILGRGKSLKNKELIHASAEILFEIQPATVRAVCYKLFTLGKIPNMSKASTNIVSR